MTKDCPCGFTLTKRGRFWAVRDSAGSLVCLTVYKKGANEVIRRLGTAEGTTAGSTEQGDILPASVSVHPRSQRPSTRRPHPTYTVHEH